MDPDKNRRQLLGSRLHSVRQSILIKMIRFIWAATCLLTLPSLVLPSTVSAQNTRLEKAASDVAAATANYRAALERVLILYERELARRNDMTELRQDLFERGVLSRREFEDGQRAVADAQKNVDDTRQAIAEADRMMTEARLAESLAKLAPLERGGYQETPGLVRYAGVADWSLATGTARLREWFLGRFGRALPVSAFGQTALHDRMGLDHRNALDVAVHPDSPEGRALMEHLRSLGVPFIAAWGAIPGSTSGAHIHVGQPSPRLTARR
jgi:hypothetical protein